MQFSFWSAFLPLSSAASAALAACGLGCVFMTWLNCAIRPGVDLVLDTIGFDAHVHDASLVITGEGRLDAQSACGKVPSGVARRAKAVKSVPVIAVGACCAEKKY